MTRLFLPSASGSHTLDARYAQELDHRWRPQLWSHISRMIAVESGREWLTERPEISLFLSRVFCYLSFKYLVFDFLALLYLSIRSPSAVVFFEAEAADPSIVISSPPIFPLPGLVPARIPINKKNTPGRPQNGSSFTRSSSLWHFELFELRYRA